MFFILAISGIMLEYTGEVSNSDFVLAIDSSSSMLADDFAPNRLDAAKEAASLFTESVAKNTNIGIVSFGGEVSIDLHPTNNHRRIRDKISEIRISDIGGTNIGDALITSGNIFEGSNPKRIVLLTDGQSNVGPEPATAVGYLNSRNITVHAIGVATEEGGQAALFVSKLDEDTLREIAEKTNGGYYKAESNQVLALIFKEIASFTVKKETVALSWICLLIGFAILMLEWLLSSTKFRMLP